MTLFDWLIPGILVILGIREFLPRAVRLFRPNFRDVYFEEDNELDISDASVKEYVDECIDKLRSLGFSPIGIRVEKPPIWGPAVKELTLVSAADHTFVCLFLDRKSLKYYFYTPFTGGEIVISAYSAYKNVKKDDILVYRANRNEVGEIFNIHKNNVQEFISKGCNPYKEYTWQSRIRATYTYYNSPRIKKAEVRGDIISLTILIACFMPLILVAVTYFRQPPAV
jgi:hypothetical protein